MNDATLKQLLETMRQENAAGHAETRQARAALAEAVQVLRQENAAAHAETRQVVRQENATALAEAVQALRQESAAAHAETRQVLRQENAAAHAETRQVLREENVAAHAETRRHTEVLIEATMHDLQLIVETVSMVNEKLDRTAADIRTEMRTGFGETHAMIKGLDIRIAAVERALHN